MSPLVVLAILAGAAALVAWTAEVVGLPSVVAFVLLGVGLSPLQDRLFPDPGMVVTLGNIGVILLMFFIGLEFRLGSLRSLLGVCLGSGTLQVLFSGLAGAGVALACGLAPGGAVVTGLLIAFSSTALVLRGYEDRREADTPTARVTLVVLLFQDLVAMLAIGLLPLASGSNLGDAAGRILQLFVVLPLTFLISRRLLPALLLGAADRGGRDVFALVSLTVCLGVSLAAQWGGGSLALGAFLGGLVLAETPIAAQVLADLQILRRLSLAFFFLSVGLAIDPRFVFAHAPALALALVGVLLIKSLLNALALRCSRLPIATAVGAGIGIAPLGEFSFVLGLEARGHGLIGEEHLRFLLALAALSMIVAPPLLSLASRAACRLQTRAGAKPGVGNGEAEEGPAWAIVVGYGPVGRTIARLLTDLGVEPVVIDLNLKTVRELHAAGRKAIYGDAGAREILEAAGIARAQSLIVTLPDAAGRIAVAATARLMRADLRILVRARYLGEKAMLDDAGVTVAAYEEMEVAIALGAELLRHSGAPEDEIRREAERLRSTCASSPPKNDPP